jgi:predicted DsbA family dithiol-disulfide isomerase
MDTSLTVTIAHDYQCPWCWIGLLQAKRLKQEFPSIALDWQGYELLPGMRPDRPKSVPRPLTGSMTLPKRTGLFRGGFPL